MSSQRAALDPVAQGLAELGLAASPEQLQQLHQYVAMVNKWNKAFNLVSRQDIDRFVPRHLLDSLSLLRYIHNDSQCDILDVGTGAGLPGLPLAVMLPRCQFHLADRSQKKIRFVNQVIRALKLNNTQGRALDVASLQDVPTPAVFSYVVSRAVATPANLWQLAGPLLADNGELILQTRVTTPSCQQPTPGQLPEDVAVKTHLVQVPRLQSKHQVLVLSRRKPT